MSLTTAPAEWDRLAPEWAALHAQVCPPAGAFATPHFQSAWWQAFADRPPPDHPCTLQLHSVRAGDELVGVLPLMRDDGLLRLIGNADVCDYMDLLAAAGRESEVADALLDHLDDCAATDLLLPGLPPTSWALALLPSAATARESCAG